LETYLNKKSHIKTPYSALKYNNIKKKEREEKHGEYHVPLACPSPAPLSSAMSFTKLQQRCSEILMFRGQFIVIYSYNKTNKMN